MDWNNFLHLTNTKAGELRVKIYNTRKWFLEFYKDGKVFAGYINGWTQLYNDCPINLMYEMYKQFINEQ